MALAMALETPRNVEFEGLEADVTNLDRVTPVTWPTKRLEGQTALPVL